MKDIDAVQIPFNEVHDRAKPTVEACERILGGNLTNSDYAWIMRNVRNLMAYEILARRAA